MTFIIALIMDLIIYIIMAFFITALISIVPFYASFPHLIKETLQS